MTAAMCVVVREDAAGKEGEGRCGEDANARVTWAATR